jgi:phosphotriesterase-related protein
MLHHGHLERVLLSQDVCWRDHLHFYGGNGYDYLLRHFVPKLAQSGVSKEQIHIMTVENPKRALAV